MEKQKVCVKCNQEKSIDNFKIRNDTGKHRNECKLCQLQIQKDYLKKTNYKKGENRRQVKKEMNASATKICLSCKETKPLQEYSYRKDNDSYRNQCKNCRNDYVKDVKKQEKHQKQQNKRACERRRTDPGFLINQRLRARITKVLKSKNAERLAAPYELLGCSIKEFKAYIEKQFRDGMSWELRNFELDHKIPCAFFNLIDIDEQKKCFHYTNFQPLSPDENNLKRDFILDEHLEYLFSIMF